MATDLKKVFSKRFLELKPNVSRLDLRNAEYELYISRPTIDKYLKGNVSKLDVAEKLYTYLSAKVDQRKKIAA